MKLILFLTLALGSGLAAPTLEHILGLKKAVRDYFHGGSQQNYEHGYGRGYGRPHGHGHAEGYGLGAGKNENSQVVYIQNGQTQQHSSANGYSNGGAAGNGYNDMDSSNIHQSYNSDNINIGPYAANRPFRQHPHFGSAQSNGNAISSASSWSNSAADGSNFQGYGNGGGGGGSATAQSSASSWSSH